MTKLYRACIGGLLLLLVGTDMANAQQILVSDAQRRELQNLSVQLNETFKTNQQAAIALAPKYGWPLSHTGRNGAVVKLQGVNERGFPIYLKTHNNTTSAATTGTNTVQPGGLLGLNLSGSSTIMNNKLAIWDGGWVLGSHQEFSGKTISIKDANASVIEHATHVAGTMVAKGVYAPAKGMAFGAATLSSYDFNNDVAEMTAAASTLLLSNHSYGGISGWSFNSSDNRWEWYGLPGDTEDYTFGFYDARTQSWDKIAYNAPYYLIVESSGNSHDETGPAVGSDYWGYRSRTDQTLVDKGPRPAGISSNDAYDVLNSTANAKNILTVGAVNQIPYGPTNRSEVQVASFSSWGPTDDGRIKPDIVGAGVNVLSTNNTSNTSYVTLSGTSMAAPNVTGSIYLLQEYYAQKNAGAFMRAATLKGLVCHTAFDGGNIGPDYIYGWGLLDMKKAAQAITDNGAKSLIKENTLAQGQSQVVNVIASGNGVLSATISWTDVQGTPTAGTIINDRTPKLVNDLDIRISDGTTTFKPWVLDPANPSVAATTGDNIRDNVEQVYIPNTIPGKAYTITISHKGTLVSGPQAYSLIVTGVGGAVYCASAPASSADSRIDNITLSNLNNTPAAGCTSYSDYTNLTVNLEQGKTYPVSITAGTCGANFNKIAKVYIDYNGDGTFDPVTELAATTTVIAGTGTYTGNISIPGTVIADNYTRMRVVLSETSDATTITPCGAYAKGETQDYRVLFTKTSSDAGVVSVNSSTPGGACAGKTNITVHLKNFGSAAISNIPVTVTITNPDNSVITLNETYTFTLPPSAEDDFILQGTFNTISGATYKITATTNLSGDPVTANNSVTTNITTGTPAAATGLQAYFCADTKKYILSGNTDGGLLWYKNATDPLPFAAGSPAYTLQPPVNNTYYAGVNDLSGPVGPASKSAFSAGGYNQFTPSILVSTAVPVIIESAKLYIGNSGKITFSVTDASGQVVSSTTINAVATRTTPGAGAQADDPNDQGKVYILNLLFPTAGNYSINTSYDNTATLFRSNGGVTGYPFNLGGAFRITGNNATSPTNPSDTSYYKNFYYYLYNMQVKSAGCAGTTRQAVTLTKPVITQKDTVLTSSFANGNQWYYNDSIIVAATGQSYIATRSGDYKVGVTINGGCTVFSDPYHYALVPLHPDNSAIGLAVFPVPASTKINVAFKAPDSGTLTLSLVNNAGKIMFTQKQAITSGDFSTTLDISEQMTGTYVLEVILGGKVYGRKILIVR
ncbi:S8 family serine peptidase [Mucilaginibacter boryungensis]|uniref:S8 family serine peptidase n=1 Tax=Mucilaginibacter boryungensis TaxID=768480 RepID=A0ABR9XE07_9SPHI|nr:S8 family serine peptidase [Mucilaginibacter boryungensis]MBE9665627.1 S8 family serine peptidase [Mucilaginibacter boryungensis]